MSTASKVTIQALEYVVKTLPVGTNLALLYVLWALLSGAFLTAVVLCFRPCRRWV